MADEEAQAALKLEQGDWEGKKSELEKLLRLSHAEVLSEREMWLTFREELLKEKAATDEKYYAAKLVSR